MHHELLSLTLAMAVPLEIAALQARGGPTDTDWESARATAALLGERGDVLLYGGERRGEPGTLCAGLTRALATLAFVPGGVRAFGTHWEVR